ncbi:MAG: RND transporter [Geobacteraceae bacterium GWC2_58_44]|nr:MAG: RND transporter [Geobacteraceae bacterium GWC2_58_44]HBG06457.1 TolC family protein [Geobacter sp.]
MKSLSDLMKVSTLGALVLTASLLVAAAPVPAAAETLSLQECISRALANAPELGEAQADIALSTAKLSEAKGYRYPQVDFMGLTGPVPRARGNQVSSPDEINSTDHWTWFERGDATLVQPIYTFGKISHSMAAAKHGIEVEKARKEQRRNEIVLKVKEYYYGVLLARELKQLLGEVRDDLGRARDTANKLLEQSSANVEEADIYKLDAFSGEVRKYLAEATKGETLALAALKSKLALPRETPLELTDARLLRVGDPIGELNGYLARAKESRPEFRQVSEGLQARKELVAAARAARYPDIFLGGRLSVAHSEGRDKVTNPWVPDEFNHFWGGVALGIKWKLDFGISSAKVAQEQAQYDRLISTRYFAEENIPLQITKYYDEGVEAATSMEATKGGYESSKKWAVTAIANFDFGVGPAKEIFDSLQQYAKMRAAYFQSVYNYNLALANLSYATGEEPM